MIMGGKAASVASRAQGQKWNKIRQDGERCQTNAPTRLKETHSTEGCWNWRSAGSLHEKPSSRENKLRAIVTRLVHDNKYNRLSSSLLWQRNATADVLLLLLRRRRLFLILFLILVFLVRWLVQLRRLLLLLLLLFVLDCTGSSERPPRDVLSMRRSSLQLLHQLPHCRQSDDGNSNNRKIYQQRP